MFSAKLFSFSRLRDLLHNGNHLSLSLSRVCALFSSRRRGIPSALLVWLSRTQAKGELIHSSFFVFMHLWEPILQPLSFHIHPGMGGCTPPRLSDVGTFRRADVQTNPFVPLRCTYFGATIRKGTRFLCDPGKQLRSSRCLRLRERISGTVPHRSRSQTPIRSELQVVPGFDVLGFQGLYLQSLS
jgi:hypothetical protein